jgi:phosphate starvation-inducible protein PhoH
MTRALTVFRSRQMGMQNLLERKVEKLVITRPAVSVEEQHGFLPGETRE